MKLNLLKLVLLFVSVSANAKNTNQEQTYAHFPDWLAGKSSCDYNSKTLRLPQDITQLKYLPADAYYQKGCENLKPLSKTDPDYVKKISFLQNQYDLFSWAQFVVLNRAVNSDLSISKTNLPICDGDNCKKPTWLHWRDTDSIFLENGCTPEPWSFKNNPNLNPELSAVSQVAPSGMDLKDAILIDQANQPVYYQKLVSPNLFELITTPNILTNMPLYHLQGQSAYLNKIGKLNVALGSYVNCPGDSSDKVCNLIPDLKAYKYGDTTGSITLKVAWKVLSENDDPSQFIHVEKDVVVYDNLKNGEQSKVAKVVQKKLGVVAFHIAHKTNTSPNWVFSTFSHINSVDGQNPMFTNPHCPTCPVNVANGGKGPTQVKRIDNIMPITQRVNQFVHGKLAAENSVLQYYNLIGTQFTTDNSAPVTDGYPGRLLNFAGKSPFPTFLANELLETFLQPGNTPLGPDKKLFFKNSSCMNCHASGGFYSESEKGFKPRTTDFMFIFEDAHSFKPQACK